MKFLCVDCDTRMEFAERAVPGDGTFAAAFRCPTCGRTIALLANPMETRLVESLGYDGLAVEETKNFGHRDTSSGRAREI